MINDPCLMKCPITKQSTSREGTSLKDSKEEEITDISVGTNVKLESVGVISYYKETIFL